MKALIYISVTIILVILIAGCGNETVDNSSPTPLEQRLPDQVMTDSEIYLLRQGKRNGVIRSSLMKVYEKLDTVLLYQLEVKFYDSSGVHISTLTADSGVVTNKSSRMAVTGNVFAWTMDDKHLQTDSLRWDSESGMVATDGYVKIRRGDDRISGWGLQTDQRLENMVIKRDIEGDFIDPSDDS